MAGKFTSQFLESHEKNTIETPKDDNLVEEDEKSGITDDAERSSAKRDDKLEEQRGGEPLSTKDNPQDTAEQTHRQTRTLISEQSLAIDEEEEEDDLELRPGAVRVNGTTLAAAQRTGQVSGVTVSTPEPDSATVLSPALLEAELVDSVGEAMVVETIDANQRTLRRMLTRVSFGALFVVGVLTLVVILLATGSDDSGTQGAEKPDTVLDSPTLQMPSASNAPTSSPSLFGSAQQSESFPSGQTPTTPTSAPSLSPSAESVKPALPSFKPPTSSSGSFAPRPSSAPGPTTPTPSNMISPIPPTTPIVSSLAPTSAHPFVSPSTNPTITPTPSPSTTPTEYPSPKPTAKPTRQSSSPPSTSLLPTGTPTFEPSQSAFPTTNSPSVAPSPHPTKVPTLHPTKVPTLHPSPRPSMSPTSAPSLIPSTLPTTRPSLEPSQRPSPSPAMQPISPPSLSIQQVGPDINGEEPGDFLGFTIALSSDGNRLAAGGGDFDTPGFVRFFDWTGESWRKIGDDLIGDAIGDEFGQHVDLSSDGKRVAIGGRWNDENGRDSGHVRILDWIEESNEWQQVGFDLYGEAAGDRFGHVVAISSDGNRVAVGADENDGNGSGAGHVRVFEWAGGPQWRQVGADLDGEAPCDDFGYWLALSSDGNRLAVGAWLNDGNGDDSGHVRVYDWIGAANGWQQVGGDLAGEAADDGFGLTVALSSDGSRVAVGAVNNDGSGNDAGHVRIFEWSGGAEWRQLGSDLEGESPGDLSGLGLALSSDGNRVAIGARRHAGTGHLRIFDWVQDLKEWHQVGTDLDGEGEGDRFGFSVVFSADGNRVAVGGHTNDENGSGSGHVRVFDIMP